MKNKTCKPTGKTYRITPDSFEVSVPKGETLEEVMMDECPETCSIGYESEEIKN